MHLKQLKLAGFKSFVEPTVIPFSSQLIAVVGPNGCGKSNIIDAVRWVMGESSAKNLRGESMTDVIFNGSSTRKSVGQASVELVFDNSMGRLTGQYASYQEIAVKRVVTRDGDSFYYLNGSRCRRRDITDIFLGTGAGARGYSIIGQDTISRLVEARPEELRVYLEEAAGISKYKERRRETLQRIEKTRENLARVADIREELAKQLQRLERQAKAAEQYKTLKQSERLCKAEMLMLKRQQLLQESDGVHQRLGQLSLEYETHQSKKTASIKESVHLRERLQLEQDALAQVQQKLYQLNTEIARLEEAIQQQERELQRLTADKEQLEKDREITEFQLQTHQQNLRLSESTLNDLQKKQESLRDALDEQQAILAEHEQQKRACDIAWQQTQTALQDTQREVQIEQVNLKHLEQRYQQTVLRLKKMDEEQSGLVIDTTEAELRALAIEHKRLAKTSKAKTSDYQTIRHKGIQLREEQAQIEQQLYQAHDQVQSLMKEHAAMLAEQHAILRQSGNKALPEEWKSKPRLAETLDVPSQWLLACELVLGEHLEAIVLESTASLWPVLSELKGQGILFTQALKTSSPSAAYPRLIDQVKGIFPCAPVAFEKIFAAQDITQALSWLPHLTQDQSVVTTDGYWMGPGWIKAANLKEEDQAGVLFRQQALSALTKALSIEQENLAKLQVRRDQIHAFLNENERLLTTLQEEVQISQDALIKIETAIQNKQQIIEHALKRTAVIQDERSQLETMQAELFQEKSNAEKRWQRIVANEVLQKEKLAEFKAIKIDWDGKVHATRALVDEAKAFLHRVEMQYNTEQLKVQQLCENIEREKRQLSMYGERLVLLITRYNELTSPSKLEIISLNDKLKAHNQLNEEAIKQHGVVAHLQKELDKYDEVIKREELNAQALQAKIQQEKLNEQSLNLRAEHFIEALNELDMKADDVESHLSNDLLPEKEQALAALEEKIKRLGAINLVAIEEYQMESARKAHLDEQYHDLTDALLTLETAIAKMDKETQSCLKETFDQVNERFQALFPRLFGGGRAMLELTCDNLLEAGVLIMAQPPGKRNSSIHLLSGGEKAMTAVAFVVAIFQLNPSPFCMLDEVDAPLDDLNINRFCDLVREMSKLVQFFFITHNKVTMELADHLIGVTMREPGVSRVVAVDVDVALSMVEGS